MVYVEVNVPHVTATVYVPLIQAELPPAGLEYVNAPLAPLTDTTEFKTFTPTGLFTAILTS